MKWIETGEITAISLSLTEDCSLRCSYCFCGEKSKRTMDLEKAKRIIDWFVSPDVSGKAENLDLTLWGGEPMMAWPNAIAIAEYCKTKEKKIRINMTTNGMHLNEKTIDEMKKYNISALVSLDGSSKSHDKHRKLPNGEGSYAVIRKNLETYLKHYPYANVRLSLSKDNVGNFFDDVRHLYEEVGFKNIFWSPVLEDDWTNEDVQTLRDEYFKIADFYVKQIKAGRHMGVKWFDDGFETLLYPGQGKYFCGAGRGFVGVGVDGRVYPCHRFDKFENNTSAEQETFCLGIATESDIMKPKLRQMFWADNHFAYCKQCKLYKIGFCKGSCYAANVDFNGNDILYAPPMHCAEINIRFDVISYIHEQLKSTTWMKKKINAIHKKHGNSLNLGYIPCGQIDAEYQGGPLIKAEPYFGETKDMDVDLLQKYFETDDLGIKDAIVLTLLEKKGG